ncbi:MAG: methionine--tRNA ligase [Methanophagales archaeon]|nr:methionine--tRNA ligase [Methanophagales archaeon]
MKIPSDKQVLVTSALPYVNGNCHIGHLRTYVPADIYVRMYRKMGYVVTFVCGSDTHGTPIVLTAEAEGVTPQVVVARYHKHFKEIFKELQVDFDYYGQTDSETNHRRTEEIVTRLIENGYVYEQVINQAFCSSCERFLPDRYVEGRCPYCGELARGDECDQGCGKHLEPGEMIEPKCKICGSEAEFRNQEQFFFKLSSFTDFLISYLDTMGGTQNAKNYAMEWVKKELKDWCITRNLGWGVRFPGRDDLVVYVWVDAPIGYISFTEELFRDRAKGKGKLGEDGQEWRRYWKEDKAAIVHFIGTDILYHHCIFWPAMLKGAEYSLPAAVVASGMVKIDGRTFSKSRGDVVWVTEFLERFHPDTLRYYLVTQSSHTKELNFSWESFAMRLNNELVAILGNLVYRLLSFAYKNFGTIPDGSIEEEILIAITKTKEESISAIEEYEFKKFVDAVMKLADFGNSYFQREEPWHLIKQGDRDRKRAGEISLNVLQLIKAICILLEAVMPAKMEEVWQQLGMERDLHSVQLDELLVPVESGKALKKPYRLFERVEAEIIEELS